MLTFIINLDNPARLEEVRAAFREAPNVTAVCVKPTAFLRSGELDALYLSLTHAERFGSRPIPPHTVTALRTTADDQEEGWPRFIVTGMLINGPAEDTPAFVIPVLAAAIRNLPEVRDGRIRTIGIDECFLFWGAPSLTELAVLVASEFGHVEGEG